MALLTAAHMRELASAANAAPSADNRHVFRLFVQGESICMLDAPALHEPPAHRRLLGLMSVGAAMENLMLRGARLGLALQPHVIAAAEPGSPLVRFSVSAMPPSVAPDAMEAVIERRHSNRQVRFRGPPLSAEEREALVAACASVPGTSVAWLDEPAKRRKALAVLRRAEAERFRNRTLHRELFQSIRFDVGWHMSSQHGLPPGALGLPPPERLGFGLLRYWQLQRLGNVFGLHQLIGLRAADLPCRWVPHLLAITTSGASEEDAIPAGRALQRVWLSASAHGLAAQLFAAPALYSHGAAVDVPEALRRYLCDAWTELCPSRTPWVFMRIGRASVPEVRAGRPPLEDLWA
jgi:hypothetical protein